MQSSDHISLITSHVLDELPQYLEARGLDISAHTAKAGLDYETTAQPYGFFSFPRIANLFENLASEIPDELFGLHFGKTRRHGRFTLYHYIAAAAPTFKNALEVRSQFSNLITNEVDFTFEKLESGAVCGWNVRSRTLQTKQIEYLFATLLVERTRVISRNDSWFPTQFDFRYPEPNSLKEVSDLFGTSLAFDASVTRVYFDEAVLSAPLPGANPKLFGELKSIAEKMPLAPALAPTTVEKVRQHLAMSLADSSPSLARAAQEIGISVRTLQRELANSGTSFNSIVDETRKFTAEEYLTKTSVPITQIAFLVGFSDISTFSRSAKKWFGEPPSKVRKRAS